MSSKKTVTVPTERLKETADLLEKLRALGFQQVDPNVFILDDTQSDEPLIGVYLKGNPQNEDQESTYCLMYGVDARDDYAADTADQVMFLIAQLLLRHAREIGEEFGEAIAKIKQVLPG